MTIATASRTSWFLCIALAACAYALHATSGLAADTPAAPSGVEGDALYRPNVGQAGRDVVWVPTPDALVARMLQAARVTERDLVYDLGAGDGRIAIAAARDFGARAVGIEFNPELAALANRNAERAQVGGRVSMLAADIFATDFSQATVVTMYLLPELNFKLRPTLLAMQPGTRVVSHQFNMHDWEPDETLSVDDHQAYLWIVPAPVAGRWLLREERGVWSAVLQVAQQFQRIGGTLSVSGRAQPLLGPVLSGADLAFTFVDNGGARVLRGRVDGDRFEGNLVFGNYRTRVTGQRVPNHDVRRR
jgi:SAM-dependent methyltransferase